MLDLGLHLRFGPLFRPLDLVHHEADCATAFTRTPA